MPADESQADVEARQQWLRQFTLVLGTDEGDDATTFNGTITQTLMMFNGELMQQATSLESGSYLAGVLSDPRRRPGEKLQELFRAAYARRPATREFRQVQQMVSTAADVALSERPNLSPSINLIVWAGRRSAALAALVDSLRATLAEQAADFACSRANALCWMLDAQVVDDQQVEMRTGYGALVNSTFVRPLEVWHR